MPKIKWKSSLIVISSAILPVTVSASCFSNQKYTKSEDNPHSKNNQDIQTASSKNDEKTQIKTIKIDGPTREKNNIFDDKKNTKPKLETSKTQKDIKKQPIVKKHVDQTKENTLDDIGDVELKSIYSEQNSPDNFVTVKLFRHKKNQDTYVAFDFMARLINDHFDISILNNKESNATSLKYKINNDNMLIFDEKSDKIKYMYHNNLYLKPTFSSVERHPRLKFEHWKHVLLDDNSKLREIDLGKHNIDLIVDNGQVYIPFSVLNLIFFSNKYFNLQYNGSEIRITDFNSSRIYKDRIPDFRVFYDKNRYKTETKQQRINNYNFLAFMFDYFYGVNNDLYRRNGVKNFYELSEKVNLKESLLSTNFDIYNEAYKKLWYEVLNDLHSTLVSRSYYRKSEKLFQSLSEQFLSKKYKKSSEVLSKIKKMRGQTISPNGYNYNEKITHIIGDTARIMFDEFHHLPSSQIPREQWPFYDSFYLFKEAINKIREDDVDKKVKNIIIDISTNGGGSSLAMQQVAGFLSNKPINLYIFNTLSNQYTDMSFRVDTNEDNKYDEKDGFPQYNWYILTGINTFSAANLFAHWAKESGNAKIIGNKSGGGMYAIMPTVLPDGTNVNISSINAWTGGLKVEPKLKSQMPYTENGVDVDYELSYDDYYKDNIINLLKPPVR
ncbi:S41 family peptidase [Mycoplasma tauri]|uniref:S41 family peptidase n=1 Tax=Mycoplasma tauri TaxID=547987 RepID=UPI001CBBA24B|nr:S41 family peptidase [Mycoplasma tauri]MBZ4204189.1 hypothetical protein [Mycoplasma tauri]MBZ4226953.1 hypothetical protein [Mycoplasma tauri]